LGTRLLTCRLQMPFTYPEIARFNLSGRLFIHRVADASVAVIFF